MLTLQSPLKFANFSPNVEHVLHARTTMPGLL